MDFKKGLSLGNFTIYFIHLNFLSNSQRVTQWIVKSYQPSMDNNAYGSLSRGGGEGGGGEGEGEGGTEKNWNILKIFSKVSSFSQACSSPGPILKQLLLGDRRIFSTVCSMSFGKGTTHSCEMLRDLLLGQLFSLTFLRRAL